MVFTMYSDGNLQRMTTSPKKIEEMIELRLSEKDPEIVEKKNCGICMDLF